MIGTRIKKIRKQKGLSQKVFADMLGTSSGYISEVEQGKILPGGKFFISLSRAIKIDLNWLILGEGSPYIIGDEKESEQILDVDPEVNELLDMTRVVIKSDTGYAHSLKANIRSFYDAVETKQQIQNLEQRVSQMEKSRGGKKAGGIDQSSAPKINGENIKKRAI